MVNYFELLGLTPQFTLDLAQLESAYFTAQRECHPDRFVGKSAADRQAAMNRSIDVNDAYQTLKDPLSRAQYLLSLQGIRVGTDNDSVKPSQELLIEAMEMREEPSSKATLSQTIQQSIAKIGEHYTKAAYNEMAQETIRLGYLMKAAK
jgi:molecular chaperone HscB